MKEKAYAIDKKAFIELFVYFQRQWLVRVGISLKFFHLFDSHYSCVYFLYEGAVKISVFGQDFRTTGTVEAYNKQLGDTMAKHGSFFRFVLALNQQEYAKSSEMEQ